ncbi:MAG: ABC transporter permease [Pedosphaera sp.]|nr:ABC transporter permease [Pedosphaera sp.]
MSSDTMQMMNDQPQSWLSGSIRFLGQSWLEWMETVHRIGAFTLITLGVVVTKWGVARQVVYPEIREQIARCGLRLFPTVAFLGFALGFVIIGQTVALLTKVGATNLSGVLMVTVVVRELGPLTAALVVLGRVGTAAVIELGMARALGEVEALEALGIDPIHYLVVPRFIGLTVSIFCLAVYLILVALGSGWVFGFLEDLPMKPAEYFGQIAAALRWEDFLLLTLKTLTYGSLLSLIVCYHGLAQPMRIEEVSRATTRTVAQAVVGCVFVDGLFIVLYLLL